MTLSSSASQPLSPRPAPPPRPVEDVCVIIPTRNEAGNVGRLLTALGQELPAGRGCSVLFVDDSTDGTPAAVEEAAPLVPFPVSVLRREEPTGGLGGAVLAGVAHTTSRWIVVMDADLQHPPSLVPLLVSRGEETGAALVVASRYTKGGDRGGLKGPYRLLVSGASTALAKGLFPGALRGISDPMSGFFAVRRTLFAGAGGRGAARTASPRPPQPLGYKILLELAVRLRPRRIAEVPYVFGERHAGESKSNLREGLRFLRHLARLRLGEPLARALGFALIGVSGFLPNLLVLALLIQRSGMHYATAEIVANQFGLLWNFVLVDRLLYRSRRSRPAPLRLLGFFALANADLVVRIPLTVLLVEKCGLGPATATALALLVAFALRFLGTDRFLYRTRRGRS